MLTIRSFRNSDPPKLVEIWRQFFLKESQKVVDNDALESVEIIKLKVNGVIKKM